MRRARVNLPLILEIPGPVGETLYLLDMYKTFSTKGAEIGILFKPFGHSLLGFPTLIFPKHPAKSTPERSSCISCYRRLGGRRRLGAK